jgi:hypothetical protein
VAEKEKVLTEALGEKVTWANDAAGSRRAASSESARAKRGHWRTSGEGCCEADKFMVTPSAW